ncbi:MAG: RluA family pseudouridine synthase [Verrucomicrobiota bacterium]|nr:RluA family pseudouridine synthase [Verrucomicrobiota bacterium]
MKNLSPFPLILFEDEHLIAFDKPSGLPTTSEGKVKDQESLMALVHAKLPKTILNTHRLDLEISGIVLCAKNKSALDKVCGHFQSRNVEKTYSALVQGTASMEPITINGAIGYDPLHEGRMRVSRDGKPAETIVRALENFKVHSLIEARPLIGRTHQIQVHLASILHPIVGDTMYGGNPLMLSSMKDRYHLKKGRQENPLMGRLALHLSKLSITHPISNEPLSIESPLPKDFEVSLRYLRKYSLPL